MPLPTHTNRPKFAVCTLTAMRAASDLRPLRSRYEISGPLEYHIQTFPSSLYVGPFIFKPVFICIFTVHADENWLVNEWTHIQGRRKYLNMILQRSRYFMSVKKSEAERTNERTTRKFSQCWFRIRIQGLFCPVAFGPSSPQIWQYS